MNKHEPPISKADGTTFEILAERVKDVHNATSSVAKGAVNQLLTIRNWAIGCYIVEYEQEGCDRAKYGARLLQNLADEQSIKGLDRSMLSVCRLFYIRYPQICETVSHKLQGIDYFPENLAIIEEKLKIAKISAKIAVRHNMTYEECIFASRTLYPAFFLLVGGLE